MPHDIFISHSTQDAETAKRICLNLEANGSTCWIAPRDISGGEAWDEAIMSGLENCRMVLLLLSKVSSESPHVKKEIIKTIEKGKKLLPVRIEDIQPRQLEYVLTGIQWIDVFSPPFEDQLPGLRQQVARMLGQPVAASPQAASVTSESKTGEKESVSGAPKPRVALLYKRNTEPDGHVLKVLESGFKEAGYDVFVDRHMQIGVEWAHEIERNIRTAEAVIPILSESSIQSEMVNYEVEIARSAAQSQHGKPHILPVRAVYKGPLSESLDGTLKSLQYALWETEDDDQTVLKQLLATLKEPPPQDLKPPNGALPSASRFYVPRPSDVAFADALSRKDAIVLIKGGRQMGKTSLLVRGLNQARELGATVVYTDFQKMNNSDMKDLKSFYFALARILAWQLEDDEDIEGIDDIEKVWKEGRAASVNFERYLKKQIMAKITGHMYWALDEVDRLFTTEFGSEVFGLFRSWHNERATNPETPFVNLTMIIAYATEAHLFIADPNQSPFNVGTRLELRDFNLEQEEELNKLFGNPLFNGEQVNGFDTMVNGQPYLVSRGLYELATTKMSFDQFAATADLDEGPFGDHLRRILVMLVRDSHMIEAVKTALAGNTLSMEAFYRLRAAGLVVGEGASSATLRCQLYAKYLRRHLIEGA